MRRFTIYIILAAASMYMALIYRNETFLNICYGQLCIVALLAVLNIISIRNLEVFMSIPKNVVQTGKRIPVNITINNNGILPAGKIEVKVESLVSYSGKKEFTKFYGSTDSHSSTVLRCSYITKNPGNIEFSIKSVWANDFLGILKLPVLGHYIYKQSVVVIPELYEMPILKGKSVYEYIFEDETVQNNSINFIDGEDSEHRPYIAGDSLKNIHWKLSAKTDEFMVRQKYNALSSGVVFLLDLGTIESDYIKRCFIQAVLSVSTSLLFNEIKHYICWYNTSVGEISRFNIKQENDLYSIVQECINKISEKHRENTDIYLLKNMYARQYNMQDNFTYLALNTSFELYVNDWKVAQYNYNNLKESVSTTEIQL